MPALPVPDALLESHIVDLIGPQHFYDSVRAAKKGLKPDGLPVVLDWANVTAQFEIPVDTLEARQMLMREGFAYVHVSAQKAGLCCTPTCS